MELHVGFNQQNKIIIATPIKEFGILVPIMLFSNWEEFGTFYHALTIFYESEYPKVPDVFKKAFGEELDG